MRKQSLRQQRRDKSAADVDITSLLDVLVILLVFLLKSYNASDLTLDLAADLTLPNSNTQILGNHAVIVQVNKDSKLFVNNNEVGAVIGNADKIPDLFDRLTKLKEEDDLLAKKHDMKKPKNINLVFDASLPYATVRKVMHTAALAGYPQFKFIVQANY
tara:strand:- start:1541 stop:2017 length:477 start_codon:yes stop_codon:yes gene_type:complete